MILFSQRMRSTRQKLKLLRGISRASANGGSGLTSRKSSNGNHCSGNNHSHHHLANGNSGVTSNGNGSIIGEQASNYPQQQSHKQHHPSTALTQHNNQFYNNSVSPTTHHHSTTTNSVGSGRHQRFQAKSQAETTIARSGAVRTHTTSSFSSPASPAPSEASPTSSSSRSHSTSEVEPFVIGTETPAVDNNNSVGKGHVVDDTGGTHINPLVSSGINIGLGHPHRQWTQFLTTNMDCTGLNSDIREKAFGICRDYLHGAWKQIDSKDLVIKRVR